MSEHNAATHVSNFLRAVIEKDLAAGTYASRRWARSPGDAAHHAAGEPDPAKIRTRFPPEPNGYLHVGHAKSICLNFGLARDYGGVCHMRFDDTNPEKESVEYVESIKDSVQWLGFGWDAFGASHLYFASDYFDFMYRAAEYLIEAGHAYIDEQTPDEMRASRGTLTEPGKDSPWRNRPAEDSLALFRAMRDGRHADGAMVLRAKIDMASPNINMRDPAIYRIKRAHHHNTGDKWCIYPMYTYAHPLEDALEGITHSICTLEFEDQRPFYDWVLERLAEGGLLAHPLPKQYEFARLNLTYVVTSKRKLMQLVTEGHVSGWDDPRMPTIVGLRRRGYTPEAIQLFAERIGVSKADSWIDYSTLEGALRDDLDGRAARAMAVLDPVRLKLTNWTAVLGDGPQRTVLGAGASASPRTGPAQFQPDAGTVDRARRLHGRSAQGLPPALPRQPHAPEIRLRDRMHRLREGRRRHHHRRTGRTGAGHQERHAGRRQRQGQGRHHVGQRQARAGQAEVRLYDRLFTEAHPDAGGRDFLTVMNPDSVRSVAAFVEPGLAACAPDDRFQFERHGYFVADRKDSQPGRPVFNRTVTLKDSWGK
jgi:glutaminyl-tRNA synthetase